MHTLPGRLALDEENHRPNVAWRRRGGRSADAQDHWRQHRRAHHLCFWGSVRMADAKFCRKISGRICGSRAEDPFPPLPPEYTPEELIEEDSIPTVPLAHDPGWEKAGAKGTI